jgi:hypothetical protein
VENLVKAVVYAKQYKKKISTISNVIHPYPTRGGVVQRVADQYWRQKLFEGSFPKIVKKYIEWFR